jgi:hypothetical protein
MLNAHFDGRVGERSLCPAGEVASGGAPGIASRVEARLGPPLGG